MFPLGRLKLAGKQFYQSRFTFAVFAYDAYPVSFSDG